MRYLLRGLAAAAAFGIAGQAAASSPLGLTIDLLAPATPCTASGCPADINIPALASAPVGSSLFSYATGPGSPTNYLSTITLDNTNPATYPLICDEMSGSTPGPAGSVGFTTPFSNSSAQGGGALGFGSGGPLSGIVDLSSMSYLSGSSQFQVALSFNNTATQQVMCYPVAPIGSVAAGTVAPVFAGNGTVAGDRVFLSNFENPLSAGTGEPWVSALTVGSPSSSGSYMVYVLQIHNANKWTGWHVDFGYDTAYFGTSATWCVINNSYPQPGSIPSIIPGCSAKPVTSNPIYTVNVSDIQSATNSVYLQVVMTGTSAAQSNFASLPIAFYPALGAVFPPPSTYPQRLDNKVAVASANNMPVQSVGNIVCANTIPTACTVYDADGNLIGNINSSSGNLTQGQLNIAYTVSGDTVSLNPVAYFVSPSGGNTLPASNPLLASNGTFNCPASPILSTTTPPTLSTTGAALGFTFAQQVGGGVYVPGTATCTATFTTGSSTPFPLSNTQTFTITMLHSQATHFSVSAPTGSTAGSAFNFTVNALDAGNNVVPSYNGTVTFTSSDTSSQKVLPANSTLTNGTGTFSATLVTAGNQTITATDTTTTAITGTSGTITVAPAAATTLAVQAPSPQTHGQQFQVSVTAKDTYGNVATGYAGTVQYTSTDSAAVLPANQTLTSGVASPSPYVTLNTTTSTQTVTATDTANSSITGTTNPITVN